VNKPSIRELYAALILSWDEETATNGDWDMTVLDLNQCAVTALVVQDILGGTLQRTFMTNGDSHYWNKLPDGMEVDLTRGQFEYLREFPIREEVQSRPREYVLSFPDTVRRYELLRSRVRRMLPRVAAAIRGAEEAQE